MERPKFSQTLVARRRDLGLSIEQAASVLRMKEHVLRAFESGDWQSIPRAGYAQGMLSSYARYLGLNPRDVVDEFKQDLYRYTHSAPQPVVSPEADERRGRGYAERYQGQSIRKNPTDDIDLYGSAGPAGSVYSGGTFDDELKHRLARERGGHRGAGYAERYLKEQTSTSTHHVLSDDRKGGRRYTAQVPERTQPRRAREAHGAARSSRARAEARRPRRQSVREREVVAGEYQDDLRYDTARPYEAASSERGRRASRNIASTERPNVERPRPPRSRSSRSKKPPTLAEQLFTSRRLILIVIAVIFVVVMLAVIFTVQSCVSHVTSTEKPQVPVQTTPVAQDDGQATEGEGAGVGESADDETVPPTTTPSTTTTPSLVTISVADGEVSWIEITMGDVSLVAQTVTGPWEKTFTPTATMEIQASNASAVTVLADGKPLTFDSKASGVGAITIAAPSAPKDSSAGGDADQESQPPEDEGDEDSGY